MSEARAEAEAEEDVPPEPPVITLGPLENKSCMDELSDGVQSMDVRWESFFFFSHFCRVHTFISFSFSFSFQDRVQWPSELLLFSVAFVWAFVFSQMLLFDLCLSQRNCFLFSFFHRICVTRYQPLKQLMAWIWRSAKNEATVQFHKYQDTSWFSFYRPCLRRHSAPSLKKFIQCWIYTLLAAITSSSTSVSTNGCCDWLKLPFRTENDSHLLKSLRIKSRWRLKV